MSLHNLVLLLCWLWLMKLMTDNRKWRIHFCCCWKPSFHFPAKNRTQWPPSSEGKNFPLGLSEKGVVPKTSGGIPVPNVFENFCRVAVKRAGDGGNASNSQAKSPCYLLVQKWRRKCVPCWTFLFYVARHTDRISLHWAFSFRLMLSVSFS